MRRVTQVTYMTYGPTPEQMTPRAMMIGADDYTGMVFCPQRRSHIAILRCAEYQRADGCGFACPNAVTPAEIKMVAIKAKQDIDAENSFADFCARKLPACTICDGPKKSFNGTLCKKCSNQNKRFTVSQLATARRKANK